MIALRPMTGDDLADCLPLLAQLGYALAPKELEHRFATVATAPGQLLLVAETYRQITGLLHAYLRPALESPREAVVQAIVVDQGSRGRGIGRMLMAAAERWGAEQGCPSLALSSNITRKPAHGFYAGLGYRVAATSYVLRKDLPDPNVRGRAWPGHPVCRACSTARRCKSSIQLDGAKD
jgi:GNAT superfamily N-acetyltransferase